MRLIEKKQAVTTYIIEFTEDEICVLKNYLSLKESWNYHYIIDNLKEYLGKFC